jgi:hypothetical protein
MIIRARVRARLLGIRLLTLDAHIVAGSDGSPIAATPILAIPVSDQPRPPPQLPSRADRSGAALEPAGPAQATDTAPGSSVARARELVEQGTRVLDQERRREARLGPEPLRP